MLYETDGKSIGRRYPWPEDSAAGPENPSVLLEDLSGGRVGPLIYPVGIRDRLYAVLCVTERKPLPEISAQSTLQSILGECALALENEKNVREKESAAILAENERVRADLLRSISHDLRTPLTSISGNAGALLENEARFDPETRHRLTRDIYEDSLWLTELVENLLTTTRLEGGAARIQCHSELVEDILRDAVSHIRPDSGRSIRIAPLKEILLVRADARLIVQVLVNLAGNAVKYTPPDAEICLSAEREGDRVVISVADTGPGIPDEEKERVFEMFYVGKNRDTVGRKSLGLGLTLCRSIVQAHGGTIWVSDNDPHGAVFRFSLPLEEVPEHG
jgi:two-component system sensor histidine kinase KdpD